MPSTAPPARYPSRPYAAAAGAVLAAVVAAVLLLAFTSQRAEAAPTAVPLGQASSFAVLAGSGITNTGTTTITGDIGSFPTTSISGGTLITLSGTNHAGDAVTQQAQSDLVGAYNTAAGELPPTTVTGDLGGQTLVPGIYNSGSTLGLTGALTLNAGGDPDAVFVFQAGSSLTTASASSVVLENGAQACNVFWQLGDSATLGTGTAFQGNIIALTSITLTTGATVEGRVLARNGAVTLDTNVITRPGCTTSTPTTAPTTTATTTATSAPTTTAPGGTTATTAPGGSSTTGGSPTSGAGSGGSGSGGSDSGTTDGTDQSASGSTNGSLPNTGGTHLVWLPIGLVAVLAGSAAVFAAHQRRRAHR